MYNNCYRPGANRRDSVRSPDRYSKDFPYDLPSASLRDADRASDYGVERYRSSRPAPRGRDRFPESRRSASTSPDSNANMDSDRAASDIAKQLRLMQETHEDLVKWKNKRDVVLEGYRQRLATYERHGGKTAQDPSVAEAWRKHRDHYKQEQDKIEKELAKANAIIKDSNDKFARLLVKSLPIGEIKECLLIESAKLEMAKDRKSAPISPIDDRTLKLEEQMASFLESQKALEAKCVKLMEENEEQRTRIAVYEAQAADLAALKTQQDQLRLQLSKTTPCDQEIEALQQGKAELETQVATFQTQLADLVRRLDSQHADFSKVSQEATAQCHMNTAASLDSTLQEMNVMGRQVNALETQVKEHDKVFSNIDAEEYAEAVTKLIKYPDYPELKKMLDGQESELKRLSLETNGLRSDMANTLKRLAAAEEGLKLGFKGFSDKVIETCGKAVQELKDRIENVQPQREIPPGEVEEIKSVRTAIQGLRQDHSRVENELDLLRKEFRESHNAQEMMITSLDEQFKNMSTLDMANIILDNLKRLPTTTIPSDVQNLHERLVDLELFRQEYLRRGKHFVEVYGEDLQEFTNPKRSLVEDDDGLEQPEKRQRTESLRG